jgi:hypothetical protein
MDPRKSTTNHASASAGLHGDVIAVTLQERIQKKARSI